MFFLFLSSGIFLGWSLGANDAANVFGSAVGSKMIRFRTAAILCGVFVILGAVASGAGTTHTLGKLGAVDALAGSFTVALVSGLTVYWMTKLMLPVSTSQAIVGAIIGWNLFSGNPTDMSSLTKIVATWVICPLLAAVIAILFYYLFAWIFSTFKIHLLTQDAMTRWGLIAIGVFGSFSLGANNIANVMGVFVEVAPFQDFNIIGIFSLSSAQQLFFIGGVAIAIGVYTYSHKVMVTVGSSLMKLSPEMAFIVVLAHSLVLFFFASQDLEAFLHSLNLPAFPLVPVSSSQAVIGAIIGLGLVRGGGKDIRFGVLGKIAFGWIVTPIVACILAYVSLAVVQNVFNQTVYSGGAGLVVSAASIE